MRLPTVEKDGPAGRAGFREGDVILSIDRRPVTGVDDLIRLPDGERIDKQASVSVLSPRGLETKMVVPAARG